MRGWRIKFVFVLVVYFAGFATAIYTLAPAPSDQAGKGGKISFPYSAIKSDRFAKSFNSGMRKCIAFGKDAALRVAEELKDKVDEAQSKRDG